MSYDCHAQRSLDRAVGFAIVDPGLMWSLPELTSSDVQKLQTTFESSGHSRLPWNGAAGPNHFPNRRSGFADACHLLFTGLWQSHGRLTGSEIRDHDAFGILLFVETVKTSANILTIDI